MEISFHDFNARFGTTHKRVGVDEYIDYALEQGAETIAVISSGNLISEIKQALDARPEHPLGSV